MNPDNFIKTALELIKGYSYGNKITRQDLRSVLLLARDFSGRNMLKLLIERKLIELVQGNPKLPDDRDTYKISKDGFSIIDKN